MRTTPLIRPEYSERFRCIGPACEDSCCEGWTVWVDQPAYQKYASLPAGPLRSLVDSSIVPVPESAASHGPSAFARIEMLPSGHCPLLSSERLCRMQLEQGESHLPKTCAIYPRSVHRIDGLEEKSLSLSCPEAARLVLLDPALLDPALLDPASLDPASLPGNAKAGYKLTWDDSGANRSPLRCFFWPIRAFVLTLIRDRRYLLWQRLFLLGTFSRRLELLARGESDRRFPAFLRDFSAAVASGSLRAAMETVPADLHLQLDLVLRLIAQGTSRAQLKPRLRETLLQFSQGIGHTREASIESQIPNYAQAYERYYAPFFLKYPHILENYLINLIFRELYPFGPKLFEVDAAAEPARAFALLTLHFAFTKGVLIGVAGALKEEFCAADVVRTVQTVFRNFEHNPKFLPQAHALLAARSLDNPRGLTMLVRN